MSTITIISVLFSIIVITSVSSLEKRSDDIMSIETLHNIVEQQAAMIQTLQAKVAALENKESQDSGRLTSVENRLAKDEQQVGFYVTFWLQNGHDEIHLGEKSPIKFDAVITNIADGYNTSTGVFTAPVSGLYAFSLHTRISKFHNWILVGIAKGSTILVQTPTDLPNHYDKGSCFAVTHLNAGETVFARRVSGDYYLERREFTNFSGFLIAAD